MSHPMSIFTLFQLVVLLRPATTEAFTPSTLIPFTRDLENAKIMQSWTPNVVLYNSRRQSSYSDIREGDSEDGYYGAREAERSYDEDELRRMDRRRERSSRTKMTRYGSQEVVDEDVEDVDDFDDYDIEYEDEDNGEDDNSAGNYWANPNRGIDRSTMPPRRRSTGYAVTPRPRRRNAIPSRTKTVPAPTRELYDRLFFYGIDPEFGAVGDKTMFGGTKGKFNALSFMQASEQSRARNIDRRLGRKQYYSDQDNERSDSMYFDERSPSRSEKSKRSDNFRKRRRRESYTHRDSDGASDWVSRQVSSWFNDDEFDDDDCDDRDYERDDGSRNQRREYRQRMSASGWSPFSVLDTFFGVDRQDLADQADVYNQKMGLNGKSRQRRSQSRPRRKGYAYRYTEDDETDGDVVDIESSAERAVESLEQLPRPREQESTIDPPPSPRKEKSWEERALAVERVPPAGVSSWGASGEQPVDARTQAIMDALEDLQVASQRLELKKRKEVIAKEDISVLKVDAELERRKAFESRGRSQIALERLRQIEMEIDDASRVLRRARSQVKLAQDQLDDLRERHWAVLSFYNSNQAEEKISEALDEYHIGEESEVVDSVNESLESAGKEPDLGAKFVHDEVDADPAGADGDAQEENSDGSL